MAKRIIDWEMKEDGTLVMREFMGGDAVGKDMEWFDLKRIYPNYQEMNEVQRYLISYGVKQKLADIGSSETPTSCGSLEKALEAKVKLAKEKFEDFVEGKLTAVRANASGVKEAKAVMVKVNQASEVVSLEGLIIKKTLKPESFTVEDQKKLDEFMGLAVAHKEKEKSKK